MSEETNYTSQEETVVPTVSVEAKPAKKTCNCNKPLIALNIVLLLAVGALYFMLFGCCGKSCPMASSGKGNAVVTDSKVKPTNITVAFINTDTIITNYKYAKDLEKELLNYKNSLEKNYSSKMASLKSDFENYLKVGATLTLSEQKKREESFTQRQAELGKMEQGMMMEIQQKQMAENAKLLNAIYAFIKDYNQKHDNYTLILRKSFIESPVLYIDESLDMTSEILKGLNEEYDSVKGTTTK